MMDSLLLASTQPMANSKDICLKIDCNNGFNGPAPPIMRIFTIQDMVTRHYVTYKENDRNNRRTHNHVSFLFIIIFLLCQLLLKPVG